MQEGVEYYIEYIHPIGALVVLCFLFVAYAMIVIGKYRERAIIHRVAQDMTKNLQQKREKLEPNDSQFKNGYCAGYLTAIDDLVYNIRRENNELLRNENDKSKQ